MILNMQVSCHSLVICSVNLFNLVRTLTPPSAPPQESMPAADDPFGFGGFDSPAPHPG